MAVERNKLGRFLPGHKPEPGQLEYAKKKPGEIVKPHPTDPLRDSKGRMLRGNPQFASTMAASQYLKKAALEAITAEQIQSVMGELYALACDKEQPVKDRLECMREFLNRTIGKPNVEIQMNTETKSTSVNYNLHKLSDEDMAGLEMILNKSIPQPPSDEIEIEI